jgi:RimJ/RimL family protein N-acetyltransferase
MDAIGQVFRLQPDDSVRYVHVRQSMLVYEWGLAGTRHGIETLTPSSVSGLLADERSATFAIEAIDGSNGELIAVATITRGAHTRFAHRAKLVSVFVNPCHRGKGLGRAVVSAAVDHARKWPGVDFVDLCVSEDAQAAQRLYETMGFVAWGRQPEATDYHGRRVDEIHMTLRLNGARA